MHNTKLEDKQTQTIERNLDILVNEQYPIKLDEIIDKRIKGNYSYITLYYTLSNGKQLFTRTKSSLSPIDLKAGLRKAYQVLYNNTLKNGYIRVITKEVLTCQKFKHV